MRKLFVLERDGSRLDAVRETENRKCGANFVLLLTKIVFLVPAKVSTPGNIGSMDKIVNGSRDEQVFYSQP